MKQRCRNSGMKNVKETATLLSGTLNGNMTLLEDTPRKVNWASQGKVVNPQLEFKFYSLVNAVIGDLGRSL